MEESDHFDKRLKNIIVTTVDVSYGFDQGLNQAITLAQDALADVKFIQEKKLIAKFFEHIALDTGMIVFGVADTMKALEMRNVETILMYDQIEYMRYEIRNPTTEETKILFLNEKQAEDPKYFKDKESGIDLEVVESMQLGDWLCLNYKQFGV